VRATLDHVPPPADPSPAADARRLRRLFSGLAVGTFVAALDQTVVAAALPTVTRDLGGFSSYTWIATAYLVTATTLTPLFGRLSDAFGRRRPYLAAIGLFVAGSVLAAISRSMGELIASRAVQGAGAAGLLTLAVITVGDELAPRQRARYQGLFGMLFALASLVGPPLGGLLTQLSSWRWIFAVNVPLGVVAAALVWRTLPDVRGAARRVDLVGATLLVGGAGAVLVALVRGGTEVAWGAPSTLAPLAAGIAALGGFVGWERRVGDPLLPLRLFGGRAFAASCAVGATVGASLFATIFYLPLYVEVEKHSGAEMAGRLLLPLTIALVVGSGLSGRAASRTGRYRPFVLAGTALTTVGLALLRSIGPGTSLTEVAVDAAVVGLGIGLSMQMLVVAVQAGVRRADLGSATSAAGFFRSIGGTVGTVVVGAVLANRLAYWVGVSAPGTQVSLRHAPGQAAALPDVAIGPFAAAWREAFTVLAVVAAVGVACAMLLPRGRLPGDPTSPADEELVPSGHQDAPPTSRQSGRSAGVLDRYITNS
jgi:EmrB/QacA subfamily drug resistance transporter